MDSDEISMLIQAMDVMHAQEVLVQMKVADFPNMENTDRRTLHRDIHRTAYPKNVGKPMTTADLARVLANG